MLALGGLGISSMTLPEAAGATSFVTPTLAPTGTATQLHTPWTAVSVAAPEGGSRPAGASLRGRGLATDGSSVFWRRSDDPDVIREVLMDGTWVADHQMTGTFTLGDLTGGTPDDARTELAYSSGHLFLRSASTSAAGGTTLYAMRVTDAAEWPVVTVSFDSKFFLDGGTFVTGSLLDLPDGRLGFVSRPSRHLVNYTRQSLRLLEVSVTGDTVSAEIDTTITIEGPWEFPEDSHGSASDGAYLYQLGWDQGSSGRWSYKAWTLPTDGGTFTNDVTSLYQTANDYHTSVPTYLARDHVAGRYLIGTFADDDVAFYIGPTA